MIHYIRGNREEIKAQKIVLANAGISIVRRNNLIAIASTKDYILVLLIMWTGKVKGWYLYKEDLISFGICTAECFNKARIEGGLT